MSTSSSRLPAGEMSVEVKPFPDFFQDSPRLGNQFVEDTYLQSLLQRLMKDKYGKVEGDLTKFGRRCATELLDLAAEMEVQQPQLIQFDSWGRRIDHLQTCSSWKAQHVVAAEEGLIANGYQREFGPLSRVYQLAKLYLYAPSSGLYSCPLAMTDGAARLCELLLDPNVKLNSASFLDAATRAQLQNAYDHLTSRDGKKFWTSGQWMTERGGGSDVGDGTRTVARLQPDGTYKLYGFKWFTSATDAEMTITLARIEDAEGKTIPGSKGISCFFLRVKQDDGSLNNIRIHKLKNKLGTKQLPTAELELAGSVAYRLSDPGRGVALITTLVNVTRVYNAIASCGGMRRMMALMRDYLHRRTVFGRPLSENPMHLETVAEAEVQYRAATCFTFDVAERLGRAEIPSSSTEEDQAMLRLLTPLVKLYTAKQAVAVASEGLESFGGQGYIEDSKLPRLLRDAQVLPIWEGTTNVLSHDLLRVLAGTKGAIWSVYKRVIERRISEVEKALPNLSKELQPRISKVVAAWRFSLTEVEQFVQACLTGGKSGAHALEMHARSLAFGMSRVYIASSLATHAVFTKQHMDWVVLERWVLDGDTRPQAAASTLVPNVLREGVSSASGRAKDTRALALDLDLQTGEPRGYGNKNKDGSVRSRL